MLLKSPIGLVAYIFCTLFCYFPAYAQSKSDYSISFKDSVKQDENSSFIYNNIQITNDSRQLLHLGLMASSPHGWRLLSTGANNFIPLDLKPGESTTIPLTVMKLPDAIAEWLPVRINLFKLETNDSAYKQFYVMAKTVTRFKITPITTNILIKDNKKEYTLICKLLNYGSIKATYNINYKSRLLDINKGYSFSLNPGNDTTILYHLIIPDKIFATLNQDKITVAVTDNTGTQSGYQVEMVKVQPTLKQHPSPYLTFPMELETGLLQFNKRASYYGNIKGVLKFSNNRLSFFYNSKQYGNSNRIEKNIFGLNYSSRHWDIYGGQLTDSKFFFGNGNGLKVIFRKSDRTEISLLGIKHNNYYFNKNDLMVGSIKYGIRRSLVTHFFAANFDTIHKNRSYVFMNDIQLFKQKFMSLQVQLGAGFDQSTLVLPDSLKNKIGTTFGYSYFFNKKNWQISSSLQENSINYPGINKGTKYQSHNIRLQLSNKFVELFYQYSHYPVNFLRDTLYNTDILDYNTNRYGLRFGVSTKLQNIYVSTGMLKQNFQSSTELPNYQFGELYYKFTWQDYSFLLNTIGGYTGSYGNNNQKILLLNNNATANLKYGGIKCFYLQTPLFDQQNSKDLLGYNKTLLISPYINFSLFKHIKSNLSYSISKSLFDNSTKTYAGFNIRYSSVKNGLNFVLNGSLPIGSTSGNKTVTTANRLDNQYITLSVRKKFKVPVFFIKKYFDLLVVPYNDANNNGKRDKNEQPLKNIQLYINKLPFLTDDKGVITYRNIDTGIYKIKFDQLHEMQGLVPVSKKVETIEIKRSITMELAFKKSKVIFGNVKLALDSISHTQYTPDNIKITATDSTGAVFNTITNEKGDYFINLVAGKYIVSLNSEAFDDNLKPVVLSYKVDLTQKEEEVVNFEIREKKRKVRFLKNNP